MTTDAHHNQIITFGCRLNSYESEGIKRAVAESGQENLIVFNSCAVTSQAEQQLRQAVRKARRENPLAKIVVTGCAAQINPQKYALMEEVDLVLGNQEKSGAMNYVGGGLDEGSGGSLIKSGMTNGSGMTSELGVVNLSGVANFDEELRGLGSTPTETSKDRLRRPLDATPTPTTTHQDNLFASQKEKFDLSPLQAQKIKVNDIMSVKDTAPQMVSYFDEQTRAFLEIQNGCNHRCTFCIIPFGRGNSRSVLFGDIVTQVREMVARGHKEIVLTGVDISDYGKDLELKITLSQMIKRLLKLVPELPRLRLSSIDVAEIDDGFWDLLENEPRFMPYFHLSAQSGDDMILKRMKRRHTRSQMIEFCQKARKLRPEISFGADIIAGFPTEDDEMFTNSLKLIEEADIVFGHIFPYSKRTGTPAAKMPQLDGKITKHRAKLLREACQRQLAGFLHQQVGKVLSVVVEKNGVGKSENFLDVVLLGGDLKVGEIVEVKVNGVDGAKLLGEVVYGALWL